MKAYTDISQSRKLAEILPHNTADGTWKRVAIAGYNLDLPEEPQYFHDGDTKFVFYSGIGIPSWSLAALLDVLPFPLISQNMNDSWDCEVFSDDDSFSPTNSVEEKDSPVDACVELIIKLHEQKLI